MHAGRTSPPDTVAECYWAIRSAVHSRCLHRSDAPQMRWCSCRRLFGSRIHAHHLFGISDNPPLVIEIVDAEERLRAFMTDLAELRDIGLVTLERVEVLSQPGHRPTREQDQP